MSIKRNISVLVILAIIAGVLAGSEAPRVKTPLGQLEGLHELSYDGRKYSAFYGVPFAEPPVGKHRFKDPEPKKQWTGVWKANNTYICIQYIPSDKIVMGDEDCLYANVFVPKVAPKSGDNLDVHVHIHGGAFMFGSQDMYAGPAFLMDRDAILVTLNYRVGPFGFLSTEDHVVSGNMGLKDQTMALKWIHENIASFGGNPNSVTISGMSAGGASVHFHYLSPLSRGLFHRGISLSGTALAPWALQDNAKSNAKQLAVNLGCLDDKIDKHHVDLKLAVKCMRQRSAKQVIEALAPFYTYRMTPFAPFGPSVEQESNTAFLTELPFNLLKREGAVADVPWLTTVDTEEGIYPVGYLYEHLDEVNERWNEVIPKIMDFENTVVKSKWNVISEGLRDFYMKGEPLSKSNVQQFIKMNSDRHFYIGAEKSAKMQAKINKSKVWFYMFGYRGTYSITDMLGCRDNLGVSHGDDALYLFKSALNPGKLTTEDNRMKEQLVDLFIEFTKTGEASFHGQRWAPVTEDDFKYLFIQGPENANIKTVKSLYPHFWEDLPIDENEKYRTKTKKDEL